MSDEESFCEFVRARGAALSRLAYLLAGDRHHAEDLLQSALNKAALRWGRIDADRREAYVRKVLYNGAVSSWRRLRVRPESLTASVPDRPRPSLIDNADQRLMLRAALSRLTERQRAFLVLRFYEDMTESQVAAVLDVSVGTVKSQTRRALARLRVVAPELGDLVVDGGR